MEKDPRCFCNEMIESVCYYCDEKFFEKRFGMVVWPSLYEKDTPKSFFNDSYLTIEKDGKTYTTSYSYRDNLLMDGKLSGREGYVLTMFHEGEQVFSWPSHNYMNWQKRMATIAVVYFKE